MMCLDFPFGLIDQLCDLDLPRAAPGALKMVFARPDAVWVVKDRQALSKSLVPAVFVEPAGLNNNGRPEEVGIFFKYGAG